MKPTDSKLPRRPKGLFATTLWSVLDRIEPFLPYLIGGAVLACFLHLVSTNYFIRAYSDSYNWLQFARHFSRDLTQSRWPYGFPLFLRGVLDVAGPFYVFLVNLPVLVFLFALLAWFGRFWREAAPRGDRTGSWALLCIWVTVIAADAEHFTRYINPYRDPLSYVLVFASMGVMIVSLTRRRSAGLFLSGVLLGLATSVREPSLLMMFPLGLYGLQVWRSSRGELPLGRSVFFFLLGLGVALIPLALQTYATTRQIFLPAQSAIESQVIPGAHFNWTVFSNVAEKAGAYYWNTHLWLLVLSVIGGIIAIRRRQMLILALILPAALMYAIFYSFYWAFFFRYFYIVVLFLVLVSGYALHEGLRFIRARFPDRRGRLLGWIVLAAVAAFSGHHVIRAREHAPLHQIPQAMALARDLSAVIPKGAIVFAPRHLCEWIDWFMEARSYPLPLPYSPEESTPDCLRKHIDPLLASGVPLLAAEWPARGMPQGDTVHLRRLYDLQRVASLNSRTYNAGEYFEAADLYRIYPWSRHRLEFQWPIPAGVPHWFMLDMGYGNPEQAPVTLAIDGTLYPQTIRDDGAFVGGWTRAASPHVSGAAVLESERWLPGEVRLATGPLSEPMELRFGYHELFDHSRRWSGDVLPAEAAYLIPRVTGEAFFELPVPFPDAPEQTVMEWRIVTGSLDRDRVHRLSFYEGDRRLGSAEIPRDRGAHSAMIPLPRDPTRALRKIRIVMEDEPDQNREAWRRPAVPEFHRLLLHRLPFQYPKCVILGSEGDSPYLLSGFSRREGKKGGPTHRWTTGCAVMGFELPETDRDLVLRVDYSTSSVPSNVDSRPTAVRWNGEEVTCLELRDSGSPSEKTWVGRIPAARVRAGERNTLEWVTAQWSPADYGRRDQRSLGVMMRQVYIAPEGESRNP